jgi:hypothetical protein
MGLASVAVATLAPDSRPMVAGGEALRLKVFLAQQQVRLPRSLHRIAQTPEDAADERVSERLPAETSQATMRALRRPSLPIEFGATIRARDMDIYGMAIQTATKGVDALGSLSAPDDDDSADRPRARAGCDLVLLPWLHRIRMDGAQLQALWSRANDFFAAKISGR